MNNLFVPALIITIVLFFAAMAAAAVWVYTDAKKRGLQAGMWALLVVLSGNFIGLILYLLIGRKQQNIVCGNCGSATAQGAFCSVCGEKVESVKKQVKTNKSFLIICVVCIGLAFVFLGLCLGSAYISDGFTYQYNYSSYNQSNGEYARKLRDKSSGAKWELSFSEASEDYSFKRTYNAVTKTLALSVEVQGNGTIRLVIIQGDISLDETIGAGNYTYDMTAYASGRITLKVINIDASDFSATLVMKI